MLPNIMNMMVIILFKADAALQLGNQNAENIHILPCDRAGSFAAEQTAQLLAKTFGRNGVQSVFQSVDRVGGFRLNGKAEPGRKAQGTQNAQRILRKTLFCVSDTANLTLFQIF